MKKYLIATSAFSNPDLLEKTMNSLPSDIDNIIYFDGRNCKEVFNDYIQKYPQQLAFTYEEHFGCAQGWNILMKYAFNQKDYDVIVIIGSDIEMNDGYFQGYINEFEKENLDFSTARGHGFNCFALSRNCYNVVGEFDANFFPAYFEDNDYHTRVRLSGIKHGDIGNPDLFEHYGSAVIRKNEEYNKMNGQTFSMNQQYFVKKWGGDVSDSNITSYKTPFNNPNLTIKDWKLDIISYNKKRKIWGN